MYSAFILTIAYINKKRKTIHTRKVPYEYFVGVPRVIVNNQQTLNLCDYFVFKFVSFLSDSINCLKKMSSVVE